MLTHIALALRSDPDRRVYETVVRSLPDVVHRTVPDRDALWRHLNKEDVDLVIAGLDLLPPDRGAFIRSLRALPERPEIVVVGANDDPPTRARLLAAGCLAVMPQALPRAVVREVLPALVSRRRDAAITRIRAERPEERYGLRDFVSDSPATVLFLETASKLVDVPTSVLILGETGVGKERLARAIHYEGARSAGPFLALNCGALAESLLESELFGHEEGAFTGAHRARKGYFELAHGGTLFLDEIGEMPLAMQVKLLRVLEERAIFRVGGEKPLAIDVRVMAATNRDLEAEVEAGRFRTDLFYRLAVVTLRVPPLRERRADIPKLAESYLEHFRLQTGRRARRITDEAMEVLLDHDWPGNVRELRNVLSSAAILTAGDSIGPDGIRIAPIGESAAARPGPFAAALRDRLSLRQLEEAYIREVLRAAGGNRTEAARVLGINRKTLLEKRKRYGIP